MFHSCLALAVIPPSSRHLRPQLHRHLVHEGRIKDSSKPPAHPVSPVFAVYTICVTSDSGWGLDVETASAPGESDLPLGLPGTGLPCSPGDHVWIYCSSRHHVIIFNLLVNPRDFSFLLSQLVKLVTFLYSFT